MSFFEANRVQIRVEAAHWEKGEEGPQDYAVL